MLSEGIDFILKRVRVKFIMNRVEVIMIRCMGF